MSIPSGVGRIVLSGHMPGGTTWETGWWAQGANFATNQGAQTVANSVVVSLAQTDVGQGLRELWSPDTGLDRVKVYGYPNGGPVATTQADANITSYNGIGTTTVPYQCSLVATLLTGQPGRRHRGRMYWPCTGLLVTNHQAPDTVCDDVAKATGELIRADSGSTAGPIVLSQMGSNYLPVSAIRVDSKIDTQRNRASKVPALFTKGYSL